MKKSILLTSFLSIVTSNMIYAQDIVDVEGKSLQPTMQYYLKSIVSGTNEAVYIYPEYNENVKSIMISKSVTDKHETQITEYQHQQYYIEFPNSNAKLTNNRIMFEFSDTYLSTYSFVPSNDNNSYYVLNNENQKYLACHQDFENNCLAFQRTPQNENRLTKVVFVPKVKSVSQNDYEKALDELARFEIKVREELARWDSQVRNATDKEQLEQIKNEINQKLAKLKTDLGSLNNEYDKKLTKFDSEKLQPLLIDLNNDSSHIIAQIDQKLVSFDQRMREEAERLARPAEEVIQKISDFFKF
ncbi:hypothetical protein [Silvanigrella aquatica]|uniref:Uncharacterized protein n=1 Tax=Silvanigrella aquatica TaxID=1915309 RepID=A0A1L4D0I0_9BACT|nr:hypothetical protein [Silvanigrella aquatica]APJ03690.1 hypothetical protein AXG55_07135 [Silvanigrella aquatica]